MQFRTEFPIVPLQDKLKYGSKIICIGSCFSEEIGGRLMDLKFHTLLNPSGIIYNPVSLANELNYYCGNLQFNPEEVFHSTGLFRHFDFHSRLADPDKQIAIDKINSAIHNGKTFLSDATHLVVTFGTSIVYISEQGKIVANNHKVPAGKFKKSRLTVSEIVTVWSNLRNALFKLYPQLQILFTLSPVRHIRDGMIENQISKSTLYLAIQSLLEFPQTYYFPSYELMLDDLRDYRFYKQDLIHPNETAVDYIFDKFSIACMDAAAYPVMETIREIQSAKKHKLFFPDSEETKLFKQQMLLKTKALQEKYNALDLEDEIKYFSS